MVRRPVSWRYGAAVLSIAVALLLKLLLDPLFDVESPFLLFYAAVIVSAWQGGLGPGLLATALAAVLSDYFFLFPAFTFSDPTLGQTLRLVLFATEGTLISLLSSALYVARRRSEDRARELARSEARLRGILETSQDGIWLVNADGRTGYVNARLAEMLGHRPEEMVGRPFYDFLDEAERETARAELERRRWGRASGRDVRLRRKDGGLVWAIMSTSPMFGPEGDFAGAVATVTDITGRKRAEEALRESEERFRTMVEYVRDYAIFALDAEGRMVSWNAGAERTKGYTAAEILGRHFSCFYPGEDVRAGKPERALEVAARTGRFEDEGWRVRKDGSRFWANVVITAVGDAEGRLRGFTKVTRDITDRKRHEDRLQILAWASAELASSLDYETTLEKMARASVPALADWCAVDVVEPDGSLRRLAIAHEDAAALERLREIDARWPPRPDEPHGIPAVVRTGRPELVHPVDEALLTRTARDPEHLERLRSLGIVSYISVPLSARGRVLGAVTLATGQSGRRYGEEDLELAQQLAARAAVAVDNARLYLEAQQANRAKDEFLATISHELRTPLTAMLGWARMLREGQLDPETTRRGLEAIERNTVAQAQLIGDLLDVSRIVTGKLRMNVAPVDLGRVVGDALEVVGPAAEAKRLRLEVWVDPELGPVRGDAERLQQVVWNLVSNAIKFTPPSGTIWVSVERAGSVARLQVSDTGQGIAPELLPRVFDRFRQAEGPTTRSHGGLGIGLAVVRHLVELHGGTVRAESPGPGQGATFVVEIPLAAPRALREEAAPLTAAGGPASLAGTRVLVVDDDGDTRELLAAVLRRQGAEVRAVESADQALLSLETSRPDVLVSDIGMPRRDGYELIRAVRSLEEQRGGRLPALALTAFAGAEDRRRALNAGFQMHVAKPVDPQEFAAAVASVAGRGRG